MCLTMPTMIGHLHRPQMLQTYAVPVHLTGQIHETTCCRYMHIVSLEAKSVCAPASV